MSDAGSESGDGILLGQVWSKGITLYGWATGTYIRYKISSPHLNKADEASTSSMVQALPLEGLRRSGSSCRVDLSTAARTN